MSTTVQAPPSANSIESLVNRLLHARAYLNQQSVPRPTDGEVLHHLRNGRSVLLRGPHRFGKTRLTTRVLQAAAQDPILTRLPQISALSRTDGTESEKLSALLTGWGVSPVARDDVRCRLWEAVFRELSRRDCAIYVCDEFDKGAGGTAHRDLQQALVGCIRELAEQDAVSRARLMVIATGYPETDQPPVHYDDLDDLMALVMLQPFHLAEVERYIAPILAVLGELPLPGRRLRPALLVEQIQLITNGSPEAVIGYSRHLLTVFANYLRGAAPELELALRSRRPEDAVLDFIDSQFAVDVSAELLL